MQQLGGIVERRLLKDTVAMVCKELPRTTLRQLVHSISRTDAECKLDACSALDTCSNADMWMRAA
jgi:hypothetical protein